MKTENGGIYIYHQHMADCRTLQKQSDRQTVRQNQDKNHKNWQKTRQKLRKYAMGPLRALQSRREIIIGIQIILLQIT